MPDKQPTVLNGPTSQWVSAAAIADPTGGTPDPEARVVVVTILAALRAAGVIAGAASLPSSVVQFSATERTALLPAIADVAGGANIDANARTAITGILVSLRNSGVIAGATREVSLIQMSLGTNGQLAPAPAVADVAGGTIIDAPLRVAVNSALAALRAHSLIAS